MRERYADDCALCRAMIYVEASLGPMTENFCSTCRIAIALESIAELLELKLEERWSR